MNFPKIPFPNMTKRLRQVFGTKAIEAYFLLLCSLIRNFTDNLGINYDLYVDKSGICCMESLPSNISQT